MVNLEYLEQILSRANETERKEAINRHATSELLGRREPPYMLLFGQQYNAHRNQFWYDAENKKLFIDYGHNLNNVVESALNPLSLGSLEPLSEAKKHERRHLIFEYIKNLIHYLNENLRMFDIGAVDLNGQTLGIPNSKISEELKALRERAVALSNSQLWTAEFRAKLNELFDFYKQTIAGYSIQ